LQAKHCLANTGSRGGGERGRVPAHPQQRPQHGCAAGALPGPTGRRRRRPRPGAPGTGSPGPGRRCERRRLRRQAAAAGLAKMFPPGGGGAGHQACTAAAGAGAATRACCLESNDKRPAPQAPRASLGRSPYLRPHPRSPRESVAGWGSPEPPAPPRHPAARHSMHSTAQAAEQGSRGARGSAAHPQHGQAHAACAHPRPLPPGVPPPPAACPGRRRIGAAPRSRGSRRWGRAPSAGPPGLPGTLPGLRGGRARAGDWGCRGAWHEVRGAG
jgi:hypothetical protein